jgi:hypothetical protein
MENRKKFYSNSNSKWREFDIYKRYECVRQALDVFNDPNGFLDEQDLKFVIKNAFVSKIYVSEEVVKAYPLYSRRFGNLSNLYDDLVGAGVLDIQDHFPNLTCQYLELCELGTMVYALKKKGAIKNDEPSIRIEHVIPGQEYFDNVKKIISFDDFKEIFDVVSVCLVTEKEDKKLSDAGLRQTMPPGIDYKVNPFARYHSAGIKLHGWNIINGILIKQP